MKLEYDQKKSTSNKADKNRNIGFEAAHEFDWDTCIEQRDSRYDYDELRFVSYGYIGERLHVIVWTPRGKSKRIISLRKANKREQKFYEQKRNIHR